MQVHILHHGKRWARPVNHLDGRVCPECHATVHGAYAQKTHEAWHAELAARFNALWEFTGYELPDTGEIGWTGTDNDREAVE